MMYRGFFIIYRNRVYGCHKLGFTANNLVEIQRKIDSWLAKNKK